MNRLIAFVAAIVTAWLTYWLWNTPENYFSDMNNINDGIVLVGCVFFAFSSVIAIICIFTGDDPLEQFLPENIFRWWLEAITFHR